MKTTVAVVRAAVNNCAVKLVTLPSMLIMLFAVSVLLPSDNGKRDYILLCYYDKVVLKDAAQH